MEINITYKSPEHEAAFLPELQRIPHIVNPESGRINPYWGASLYLLSALTRWPSSVLPSSVMTTWRLRLQRRRSI